MLSGWNIIHFQLSLAFLLYQPCIGEGGATVCGGRAWRQESQPGQARNEAAVGLQCSAVWSPGIGPVL